MSETSISLKAYAAQNSVRRPGPVEVRTDDEAEYQAFAFGRVGRRPEIMIEFCRADGYRLTLQYIDLKEFETHDPAKGFVIFVPARRKIIVEGSHLEKCYQYLRQNRIAELIEADRPTAMGAASDEAIITSLRIQKTTEQGK